MFCFSYILGALITAAVALKIIIKLRIRQNGSYTCLVGKTAIITGANAGIGYFTALDFAKRGARVILACRNKDRAEDAQRKIIRATGNSNVVYKLVDLCSLESVRAFAKDINESEERIDILVNNAGALNLGDHVTNDGIQILMQSNHVSPFLLTHLLIDKIKKSAPSRIVNVSSMAAKWSKMTIETFNEFPKHGSAVWREQNMYFNTKLANILFTTVLAEKLRGTGVTTNALHPGAVKTEILRHIEGTVKRLYAIVYNLYFLNSEEGAQTTIYVATSQKLKDVTGKFFDNCKEVPLYQSAQNPILAKQIWEASEELARLKPNEKIN